MNDPEEQARANPPQRPTGSETERALEDLQLEPTLQELDPEQAEKLRGGQAGMMGMSGIVTKQTPLF